MFMFLAFGGTGLILVGLGLPLWLRRVPPNHIYGFRSRATLGDEVVWYETNTRGGRDFVFAGVLVTVVAAALFAAGVDEEPAALVDSTLLTALVLLVAFRGIRFSRALRSEREAVRGG